MARTPPDKQSQFQRRNRIAPIGTDAGSTGAAAFAKAGFADPGVVLRWTEIVGAEVARLAQPVRFSGGILTLRATPGTALFLAHEKRLLIERINLYLGRAAVTQIKFSQSPLAPRLPPKNMEKKPGPLPEADPVRVWDGPETLGHAIEALARRRSTSP